MAAQAHRHRVVPGGRPIGQWSGGIVLAYSTDTSALDRIVAEDPFVLHQLVDVGVRRFEPALRAPGFWAV
ncbi:hypothetical protein FQJ88_20700 [Xanthomonas vasicola]|uniref:YCII-related domain-containing protein n=1 Tax=Xanthomonas vasicola TaxID=56459 RepID=A0ABD7S564_XANVA|nr:hypothetical protein [Xanthomonas vasicola]AZR24180.1 hypothetical protein NX81_020035 [Xanthomonas vasicola]TWQ26917.1 hypothetical protein FQJ97_03610 [Xanthomonas vasicola]TWQ49805.1 hypothetical protein FQK01_20770 [Xanthomonas vasicola]TWQ51124.1 hypothetical protein FQJ94_19345 [Xanthomonas vasicola]TWQ61752.1 hypothetical protein FQJ90_20475 [Xanthomonas vasicola]